MLRYFGPLAAILVTTALAACSGAVVEGDGGSSGDPTGGDPAGGDPTGGDPSNTTGGNPTGGDPGNTTGGNPTGGNPTPIAGPAVAHTRAQIDVLWEEYWEQHGGGGFTSGSSGGTPLDPNDLLLRASDVGVSCGSPTVELDCGSHWQVTLVLPPALQQVGLYDLSSDALVQYSSMSETGPDEGSDECWGGGGSIGAGTLEITAIDATQVDFVLTVDDAFDSDPSGTYSAPRCP